MGSGTGRGVGTEVGAGVIAVGSGVGRVLGNADGLGDGSGAEAASTAETEVASTVRMIESSSAVATIARVRFPLSTFSLNDRSTAETFAPNSATRTPTSKRMLTLRSRVSSRRPDPPSFAVQFVSPMSASSTPTAVANARLKMDSSSTPNSAHVNPDNPTVVRTDVKLEPSSSSDDSDVNLWSWLITKSRPT